MEQLPDIPALESVEIRELERPLAASFALLIVGGVMGLFVWAYVGPCQCAPDLLAPVVLAVILGGGCLLWVLHSLLFGDFCWRTNADGLHSRSLVRRRFVRWEDMKSAPRIAGKSPTLCSLALLDTSIWQHLRRHDKADQAALLESSLSLWDEIPGELPSVIEWDNPRPVRRWHRLLVVGSAILLVSGLWLVVDWRVRGSRDLFDWMSICWMYGVLFWGLAFFQRMQPEHISLSGDTLQARTVRAMLEIRPSDVTAAWWAGPGMLHLRTRRSHLVVPLDSIHDESSKLVLGIIRWLRTAPKPVLVVIPQVLRTPFDGEVIRASEEPTAAADRAEIHLGLAERIMVLALALMFGVPVVGLISEKSPAAHVVAESILALALLLALTWWLTGSFAMTADTTGFAKSFLWWRKRVEWSEVANYTVGNRAGSGAQNTSMRCTLWSSGGRRLVQISPQCGPRAEWEAFMGFVFALLSEVMPKERFVKSWKARPWPGYSEYTSSR